MRNDYSEELSPEVREKMKKNLVYITIFSIMMFFAGFTSAYIVSMGDSFWLKFPFPNAFYISTTFIALSSITLILAITAAKKNKIPQLKAFMAVTFLLGICFVIFQFRGYKALVDRGLNPVNNHILVVQGKYGDFYEIKYKGDYIEVIGNEYLLHGKPVPAEVMQKLQAFAEPFTRIHDTVIPSVPGYGDPFMLYYKHDAVFHINGQWRTESGEELGPLDLERLQSFATHVRDGRGDFFARGKMGRDFHLYFKGNELSYQDRDLMYKGKPLSKYLQSKAMEAADTATTFLYLITILHLLHVLVTMIYMLKITINSFRNKYNKDNTLSLRLGAIFWHFLGLLWLYLLLFLLFIH